MSLDEVQYVTYLLKEQLKVGSYLGVLLGCMRHGTHSHIQNESYVTVLPPPDGSLAVVVEVAAWLAF